MLKGTRRAPSPLRVSKKHWDEKRGTPKDQETTGSLKEAHERYSASEQSEKRLERRRRPAK